MFRLFSKQAARADRDAQPLSETDFKRMKRTPQAKIIRRALELTQEEFAARYHIPLGTLRDWEQGRAEPDQPARAFLTLIARDPDHVHRTLNPKPNQIRLPCCELGRFREETASLRARDHLLA